MVEVFLLVLILGWLGLALAVAIWAEDRGRDGLLWFIFAAVTSPLLAGVFLAISKNLKTAAAEPSSRTHVRCIDCAELVLREARVCKHCGAKLDPQPLPPPAPKPPPQPFSLFDKIAMVAVVVFVVVGFIVFAVL